MTFSAPCATLPLIHRSFSRRNIIRLQPKQLWRIEGGVVRTGRWSEEGTFTSLGYWGVGDVVGQPLSRLEAYQIECLTDVEVRLLPQMLWQEAVEAIILHVQQLEELLSIVHLNPIPLRLWKFLVFLGQKFGRDLDNGRLIDLLLTHQQIAEAINTTRVNVTRILQQFEQEGMLLRHSKRLILTGVLAGGEQEYCP